MKIHSKKKKNQMIQKKHLVNYSSESNTISNSELKYPSVLDKKKSNHLKPLVNYSSESDSELTVISDSEFNIFDKKK